MATLNLVKGEKIDLTKGNDLLKAINIGGGWDINPNAKGDTYDLDIFAVGLNAAGKPIDGSVVYFNKMEAIKGVKLHGDNLTGEGDGDDETITVKLNEVPEEVQSIVFGINIYQAVSKKQRFGMVQNAFVRVYNTETEEELAKFDLNEDYGNHTGVIAAKLYRHNGEWKFEAIGDAADGSIADIVESLNK